MFRNSAAKLDGACRSDTPVSYLNTLAVSTRSTFLIEISEAPTHIASVTAPKMTMSGYDSINVAELPRDIQATITAIVVPIT
jgi:hypothetical protein